MSDFFWTAFLMCTYVSLIYSNSVPDSAPNNPSLLNID